MATITTKKKAKDIADMAFMMATDVFGPSKYRKNDTAENYGYQYNVGIWENGYWHSDCLGFVHICVNGFFGDRNVLGGGAVMDNFVLASDEWTTLHTYCANRGGYPVKELKPASLLQNSGHVGLYIGERVHNGITYNTAECTLALAKGWLLTWVDLNTGDRYAYKGGAKLATSWSAWGEFMQIDYSEPEPAKPFTDVDYDTTGGKAIMWAYDQGIVKGYKDSTFRPKDSVTREQMCIMLQRALGGK